MELNQLSAIELAKKLKSKEVSAKEILDSVYKRIDSVEGTTHAYLSLTKDLAYKQAEVVDGKILT